MKFNKTFFKNLTWATQNLSWRSKRMSLTLNRKNCKISFDDPKRGTISLIILQSVCFEKGKKMENGIFSRVQSEPFRSFPILNLQNIKYSCKKDISYFCCEIHVCDDKWSLMLWERTSNCYFHSRAAYT